MVTDYLPLAAPAVLFYAAAVARRQPGRRPVKALRIAERATLLALGVSALTAVLLLVQGPATSAILGIGEVGLSSQRDAVSAIVLMLVSFIGWVVVRYSCVYLDGASRQGAFIGWMSAILGAVLLLVQAGNLWQFVGAWLGVSVCLHRLLQFYPHRIATLRAARKSLVMSVISDGALIGAAWLLFVAYGTSDISTLLALAGDGVAPPLVLWATALLALSAIVKSAQFPLHGWLLEVMETPTPVSAMLHAGIVNAGGFLLIRFADIMLLNPGVLAALVMIGGFTALLGGLAMLAQSAVKTSLAWSTIGQMGFMIMQCGLALFPLALLHIVAHSLYKAHAFLSAGNAVDTVAANQRPGPVAVPGMKAIISAFALALGIYALMAVTFNSDTRSVQAVALGAILVLGVAYLLAQGFADAAPKALTVRTALYAVAVSAAYFILQRSAEWLLGGTLPATPPPGPLEWVLLTLAVGSFALVAIAQSSFPHWAYHPAAAGLRVHLSNGLYTNAMIDRLLGKWSMHVDLPPAQRD